MPIRPLFRSALDDPQFWPAFFGEIRREGGREAKEYVVDFPVGEGYGLTLRISDNFRQRISLAAPGLAEPVPIAWDYEGHRHSYILRWTELEVIARAVALLDPDLPYPGPAFLLLCQFAPITVGDQDVLIAPMLEAAWRAMGVESSRVIAARFDRIDCRGDGITWRSEEPFGWYTDLWEGDRPSSGGSLVPIRDPTNREFPFSAWNTMLDAARRTCSSAIWPDWVAREDGTVAKLARTIVASGELDALPYLADSLEEVGCDHATILGACRSGIPARSCWVVEVIAGVEPGTLIRSHFGRLGWRSSPAFSLQVELPVLYPMGHPYRAQIAVDPVVQALDRGLRDVYLGEAEQFDVRELMGRSETRTQTGVVVVAVRLRESLDEGVALIREILLGAGVPEDAQILLTSPENRPIPLREA